MKIMKLRKHSAYPLTSVLLTIATSWSLGLAAPAPAPADFWVRDKPGRITHACTGTEPLVICLQGESGEKIIGAGRYITFGPADPPDRAEVAVLVEED